MRPVMIGLCLTAITALTGVWLSLNTPADADAVPMEWAQLDQEFLYAPHILSVATADQISTPRIANPSELTSTIDQKAYLKHLVSRITAGTHSDEERVVRWVRWLQDYFAHSAKPPLDLDGQAVYAPLWLLKYRYAHCGQTNRLVVDGLAAIGIRGRLLQLRNHVAAEAYYAGDWHYLDADLLDFGNFVRDAAGDIPSAREIMANPSMVDSTPALQEARLYPPHRPANPLAPVTALRHVFTPWRDPSNGLTTPYVWIKTATPEEERNVYYGWNYYRAEQSLN